MPRIMSRRQSTLRPVNSLKHIVDASGVVSAGTKVTVDLSLAQEIKTAAQSNRVHAGAKISSLFLSVELSGSNAYGGVARVYMAIAKNPGNNLTLPNLDSIGVSDNRKFFIHQEMIMLTRQATSGAGGDWRFPRTIFHGVIRIPRQYQRQGLNDTIQMFLQNANAEATGSADWCVQCIYKEYF